MLNRCKSCIVSCSQVNVVGFLLISYSDCTGLPAALVPSNDCTGYAYPSALHGSALVICGTGLVVGSPGVWPQSLCQMFVSGTEYGMARLACRVILRL